MTIMITMTTTITTTTTMATTTTTTMTAEPRVHQQDQVRMLLINMYMIERQIRLIQIISKEILDFYSAQSNTVGIIVI